VNLNRNPALQQTRDMPHTLQSFTVLVGLVLAATTGAQPNPYRTITGWMRAPVERVLGSMSMVDVAADGSVWIAERCGANNCVGNAVAAPILHVSAAGRTHQPVQISGQP
jgi:hypothetical protein